MECSWKCGAREALLSSTCRIITSDSRVFDNLPLVNILFQHPTWNQTTGGNLEKWRWRKVAEGQGVRRGQAKQRQATGGWADIGRATGWRTTKAGYSTGVRSRKWQGYPFDAW